MDVADYQKTYKLSTHDLDMRIILDVFGTAGITATAGTASNLFLCKVTMDIVAKHTPTNENGVRIAEPDERSFGVSFGLISPSRTSGAYVEVFLRQYRTIRKEATAPAEELFCQRRCFQLVARSPIYASNSRSFFCKKQFPF